MFHEKIVYKIDTNTTNEHLKQIISQNQYFDIQSTMLYSKSVKKINDQSVVILERDYNYTDIENSKILKTCFDDFEFKSNSYNMTFYTISPFSCVANADNITINITSDINVIVNNADVIYGNKYIWKNIDDELSVDMEFGYSNPTSKVGEPKEYDNSTYQDNVPIDLTVNIHETDYTFVIVIVLVGLVVLLLIGFVVFKKRTNKDQKIESNYFYKL